MDQPLLGHKTPRADGVRHVWCPACRHLVHSPLRLTSRHVFLDCVAVAGTRDELGITHFVSEAREQGKSANTAYIYFVNGFDVRGAKVDSADPEQRGLILHELQEAWTQSWEGAP